MGGKNKDQINTNSDRKLNFGLPEEEMVMRIIDLFVKNTHCSFHFEVLFVPRRSDNLISHTGKP